MPRRFQIVDAITLQQVTQEGLSLSPHHVSGSGVRRSRGKCAESSNLVYDAVVGLMCRHLGSLRGRIIL
jgi:hypothetical protein